MSEIETPEIRAVPGKSNRGSEFLSKIWRVIFARRNGARACLWAIAVNGVLFGLFLSCATPMYETNDDLMLQSIASGFYTANPDAHLIFTNILIGWLLSSLYAAWGGLHWYFIYLVAAHFAAMSIIAFLVVSRRGGWQFTLIYLAFFSVVEIRILLHLQFTTTAFIIGCAGLLLLVDGLVPSQPINWAKVAVGILAISLMCLIREQVALLWTALVFPFALERLGRDGWKRLVAAAITCVGLFVSFHLIDHWAYRQDPAWSEFCEFNSMRGEIHITPLAQFIPRAAPAVGWSVNDGQMFSEFYYADAEVYAGSSRMHHLLNELKSLQRQSSAPSGSSVTAYFRIMFAGDSGILLNLAIAASIWCIVSAGALRRRISVVLLANIIIIFLLSFYLYQVARLPERVAYNFPLFLHLICLYWVTKLRGFSNLRASWVGDSNPTRWPLFWKTASRTALVFCLFCSTFNVILLTSRLRTANTSNVRLKDLSRNIFTPLETTLPRDQMPLIVPLPTDSTLEQALFFYPTADSVPFHIVPYGFITHSPVFQQVVDRHQLVPYSIAAITRPNTFFMMEPHWIEPLRTFYREHYGLQVRFDTALDTDGMPEYREYHIHLYRARIGH